MSTRDSSDDFSFTVEGKEYSISEKKENVKKEQKQSFHLPSLAIGAIISGICIAIVFFGMEGISDASEPLIENNVFFIALGEF